MISQTITQYVKNAVHPVTGDELINMLSGQGYSPSQAAGGIGSAVRKGNIRVLRSTKNFKRKVNYFV